VTFSSWRLEVQRRQRSLDLSGARARARPRVKDVDQSTRITCAPAFPQIGRFGGSGLEYDIAPASSDMAATTRLFLLSLLLFVGSSHAVPGRLSGTWTRFSGSPLSGIVATEHICGAMCVYMCIRAYVMRSDLVSIIFASGRESIPFARREKEREREREDS